METPPTSSSGSREGGTHIDDITMAPPGRRGQTPTVSTVQGECEST